METMVTAMYLRLSKEDDGEKSESNSITNQRLLIRDYIGRDKELSGSRVVEYCDDGYSGTNMDRPGITELLEEVKKGRVHCIVVKDISRFSRDYITSGDYLNHIFPFMGVWFISIGDGYDSRKNGSNTMELDTVFKTLLYDFYAKDTAIKVMVAHKSRQEKGIFIGQVPFGYKRSPDGSGRIVKDDQEALIVRKIFDMALSGTRIADIMETLQREGIPTPMESRGRKYGEGRKPVWNHNTVRHILNNRFYLGEMVYNKLETKGIGKEKRHLQRPRDEWKTIPDHHEAIITEEEHQKVVKYGMSYPRRNDIHPLTGKIFCGGCGYHLVRTSSSSKNPYFFCYRKRVTHNENCTGHVPLSIIEELVLMELNKEIMLWGDAGNGAETMKKQGRERLSVIRKTIESIANERKGAEQNLLDLYEKYNRGDLTAREYADKKSYMTDLIKNCEEKEIVKWEEYHQCHDEMEKLESDMKSIIHFSHIEKLTKEVVETFIEKVYLYENKRVEIVWKFKTFEGR